MRIEQDKHFNCEAGTCGAPAPRKLAAGRKVGVCVPRRTWWLRTMNSSGRRISRGCVYYVNDGINVCPEDR
jgi:hypothetical protein